MRRKPAAVEISSKRRNLLTGAPRNCCKDIRIRDEMVKILMKWFKSRMLRKPFFQ
jgi:hypothetical protein